MEFLMFRLSIALPVVAAFVFSACGSAATPAPSSAPGATNAPGATSRPIATAAPGGSQQAGGSYDFSNAATNLSVLDSYKFDVEIVSANTTTTGVKAGTTSFTGVVNKKDGTQSMDMLTKDGKGNVTDETAFVITPTKSYMKSGAAGKWAEIPAAQVSTFTAAFSDSRPEQLFSIYFLSAATNNSKIGDETKNGVATTHYRGGDAVGAIMAGLTGVSANWQSDVWVARDKGYLVHSEAGAQGANPSSAASFSVTVDITNINGNNPVTAPI